MSRIDPNQNRYTLRAPCSNCPFRTDIDFPLAPGRAAELAEHLRAGDEFWCHKTVDYDDGYASSTVARTRACAGARATLAAEGRTTTLLQLTDRLGAGEVAPLDPDLPVYLSLAAWVESKR